MRAYEFIKENSNHRDRLLRRMMKPIKDKEEWAKAAKKIADDKKKEVDEQSPTENLSQSPDGYDWTEDDFYKLANSLSKVDWLRKRGQVGIVMGLHYSKNLNRYTCHLHFEDNKTIELQFNIDFGAGYPVPYDIDQYKYADNQDQFIGGYDRHENFQLAYDSSEVNEQSPTANAKALTASGLGGNTKKPNKDSAYLKSVRTPGTNYPKNVGANPGFVGG